MTVHDEIVLKLTELNKDGSIYLKQLLPSSFTEPLNYRLESSSRMYDNSTISHRAIRPDIVVFFSETKTESEIPYANPPINGYAIEIENDIQWDFARSLQQIKDYFQGYYPIVLIPKIYERFKRLYEHEGITTWLWTADRVWECMECGHQMESSLTGMPKHTKNPKNKSCNSRQIRLKGIKNLVLERDDNKIVIK